jgi:hypothetical protein
MTNQKEKITLRNPNRRLKMTVMVFSFPIVIAFLSLQKVWYKFEFQAPRITLPGSLAQIENVTASATLTGMDLLNQGVAKSPRGSTVALAMGPLNMPMIFTYLVIAYILILLAFKVNSSILCIGSLYVANMSRMGLTQMRSIVESTANGGQYMQPSPAVSTFLNMIWLLMFGAASVGLQIWISKRNAKLENPNRMSILDTLVTLQTANFSKLSKVNEDAKASSNA